MRLGKNYRPEHLLVEMQNGTAAIEERVTAPQKINGLPNDPIISLPGVYPKEFKAETQTDIYLNIHIHNSINHKSQKAEATSTHGQINQYTKYGISIQWILFSL